MTDGIFDSIAKSIAADLPRMAEEAKSISEARRDLLERERALSSRQEAARVLCRALEDARRGAPPDVLKWCREELRRANENRPLAVKEEAGDA